MVVCCLFFFLKIKKIVKVSIEYCLPSEGVKLAITPI